MTDHAARPGRPRTVGLLGFGDVGRFLSERLHDDARVRRDLELAFIYNRRAQSLEDHGVPERYRLIGPDAGAALAGWVAQHGAPDMVVEVSHPEHVARHGEQILAHSDLFAASVSALADPRTAARLAGAASGNSGGHGLYLPAGAAWGVEDVARMNSAATLEALSVTMSFHADALRVAEPLATSLAAYLDDDGAREPLVLFEGFVAELAPLAPNNVNTMACLALAGARLGPQGTRARLVAHKHDHAHIVEIDVAGPDGFEVRTRRRNPAKPGAVTGKQTYHSFMASLLAAGGAGNGIHFC